MENLDLYLEILSVDSSSSREYTLSKLLSERFLTGKNHLDVFPVGVTPETPEGDGTENLLFSWGTPKIVFCSHIDTVPPYFPPALEVMTSDEGKDELMVRGRGSCDAKGQVMAMFNACVELERRGCTDFGLLLLSGEETGSLGAKSFVKSGFKADCVVVGEPTDNKMVSACKGTKLFELSFTGESCHSGYPEHGQSAVELFVDFVNALRNVEFPQDELLGKTTWNIGKLSSANPQNILSPSLGCRIYFRTTFATDALVSEVMRKLASEIKGLKIKEFGGDTPMKYTVLDGFEKTVAAFGSDAPQLSNFKRKILCGPGSILVAHTMEEYVEIKELEKATEQYIRMYEQLS